jgi:membrane protein YqaA with SNARE-associated domain
VKNISEWLRQLKTWVESFAQKPGAAWSLFVIAFLESSFFPIPPDVLLIALALSAPTRAFRYAFVTSVGSVLGGMFGYLIGYQFYDLVGRPIIAFYGLNEEYQKVQLWYSSNAFAAIAVAGFTPIPYKVFTIAAGAFQVSFVTLIYASALSRSARFFLVAALFYWFGPPIKSFIDQYFEALSVAFVVLFILGFFVLRWIF